MSPNTLASRIESLIDNAEIELYRKIVKSQEVLYSSMVNKLKDLELDRFGYIKNNAKNRAVIRDAGKLFESSLKASGYNQAVQEFVDIIPQVADLNAAYFSTLSTAFTPNAGFIKSLQKQAIEQVETLALNEGLIANVKMPLLNILNNNVNSGGSFTGFLEELRSFILGIDKEGKLQRHARTWATDILFGFSRAYQQGVTSDLNLSNYYYSGGAIKDTRDFCRERLDQYWKQEQVESWADLEWSGKNPNTTKSSIFMYLGGYNCRHSLIPVSEAMIKE